MTRSGFYKLLLGLEIGFLSVLFFIIPLHAFAAISYTPLAPIAGIIEGPIQIDAGGLTKYLNSLVQLILSVATALAVIMIVLGGIQYMSTDAITGKEEGKAKIQNALSGLLLALLSWLILYTINPDILSTKINETGLKPITASATQNASPIGAVSVTSTGGATVGVGEDPSNATLTQQVWGGAAITPSKVAIDTDGPTPVSWDPHKQMQTSSGLDGMTQAFVVVPYSSGIALGTEVEVKNTVTGKTITTVVGDYGPGFGEVSAYAGQQLGIWDPNQKVKNSTNENPLTYKFLTN